MFLLLLAGPMTVIPLFLYVRGVELSGLGPTGMIFFITPTCQFLLGYLYYNEAFSFNKFIHNNINTLKIGSHVFDEFFIDIGTLDDYSKALNIFK